MLTFILIVFVAVTASSLPSSASSSSFSSSASSLSSSSSLSLSSSLSWNDEIEVDWSTLTVSQVEALTPQQIAAATSSDLSVIPPVSCSGFSSPQLAAISLACAGVKPSCLSYISGSSCSGFSASCLSHLDSSTLTSFNVDQFAQLAPQSMAGLIASQLNLLNNSLCYAFTPQQIAYLGTASPYDACSGINWSCMLALTPSACSAIPFNCVAHLTPTTLSALTSPCLASLPSSSVSALTSAQLAALTPTTCSGFRSDQLAELASQPPYSACQTLDAPCFNRVATPQLNGFNSHCINTAAHTLFASATAASVGGLSLDATSGITAAQLQNMNPSACSGFNSSQLSTFGSVTPFTTCQGLQHVCFDFVLPSQIGGFAPACIAKAPDTVFSTAMSTSIHGLSHSAIAGITANQLGNMTVSACAGFSSNQLSNLGAAYPYTTCAAFDHACFDAIPADQLSGLSGLCISKAKETLLSTVLPSSLSGLSVAGVGGITSGQLSRIVSSSCVAFHHLQLQALGSIYPYTTCAGLSQSCFNAVDTSQFHGFTGSCINQAPADLLTELTPTQLNSLTSSAVGGFSSQQVSRILGSTCSALQWNETSSFGQFFPYDTLTGINAACMQLISSTAFAGFRSSLSLINLDTLRVVSVEQIQSVVPPSFWANCTCAQFRVFTSTQLAELTRLDAHVVPSLSFKCAALSSSSSSSSSSSGPWPPETSSTGVGPTALPSSSDSTNTAVIVGATVGGVAGVAVLTFVLWRCCCRRRQQPLDSSDPYMALNNDI